MTVDSVKTKTARISNIQKCCVHDGPGIRTLVFFMGCPLSCKWCQNPENLENKPVVMFDADKCTSCSYCVPECENNAISIDEKGSLVFDRSLCENCGKCVEQCYADAKTLCGKDFDVDELFDEVMKDEVFYRTSGGGVTLSGGEPTIYGSFTEDLLSRFKEAGISTAVETCGFVSGDTIKKLAKVTDVFLYDLKAFTEDVHVKWTGQSNELIKKNLEYLVSSGYRVVIRIPLIPKVNDGDEFKKMMKYADSLGGIEEINILPFHQVGSSKYNLIGHDYEMAQIEECDDETVEACQKVAESYSFKVNIGGWDIA